LGGRKGIRAVKNLGVVVGVGAPLVWLGWHPPRLLVPLPPLSSPAPEELFLLVPAYPGGPGPKAVKRDYYTAAFNVSELVCIIETAF